MSASQPTIPKFGSFRPKSNPDNQHSDKDQARGERRHHKRRRSRSRSKSKERAKPREREHIYAAKVESTETAVFVIDKIGDEKNVIYGSVHRYDVPPFHRAGSGSVLGSSRDFRIDRDLSNDKFLVLSNNRYSSSASRERYVLSKLGKSRLLRIRPDIELSHDEGVGADFLPLQESSSKRRKQSFRSPGTNSDSENDRNYRSIHGKAKECGPDDEAFQYVSESDLSDSHGASSNNVLGRRENAELTRLVEESPHDVNVWLALIKHQDTLLQSDDQHRRITNAELRSNAEIKIHMYEKALGKMTLLGDRETLLRGLMAEGSKIWELKYQSDRWEQISKENINSLLLWKSYVDFKQTTFTAFLYEDIREIFFQRVNLLVDAISRTDEVTTLYQQLIYVILRERSFVKRIKAASSAVLFLLRLTIFARESGYTEFAVAIWQSLLEINFYAPPLIVNWRTHFQQFWESEVPRIGEVGSQGWRHFQADPEGGNVADAQVDAESNVLDEKSLFRSWAAAERVRAQTSCIPAKTLDEVVEDDPYRVVLSHDIEQLWIVFPPSADLRRSLLGAFLLFCNLPQLDTHDHDPARYQDAFLAGDILGSDSSWVRAHYLHRHTEETVPVSVVDALATPSPNFQSSSDTRFGRSLWFSQAGSWRDRFGGDHGPVQYSWLRNVLKQLTEVSKVYFLDDLAEYFLDFVWKNEPDNIKKTAKGLLKKHSNSLQLYNAYALIEWARGNKGAAVGVFTAALNMSVSQAEKDHIDSIVLWKSWIWASLEDSDLASASQQLLSISNGVPDPTIETSPAVLIRVKQHLSSKRDFLLSSGNIQHTILYAECFALLEYLTSTSSKEPQSSNQGDITSALSIFTSFSDILAHKKQQPRYQELLLQSASRLIFQHVRSGPFRPALVREHLSNFLALFPDNTIFLSLYSWNESRLKIDRRVRDVIISTQESQTSQLFKIRWEIQNGTKYSAKAAFENALSSPVLKASASIWKLYLMFTITEFKQQTKDIWYRALRACPWAKELYITGFESIDLDTIEFAELKGIYRVMGEKQLRVHVDLEDQFDELSEMR